VLKLTQTIPEYFNNIFANILAYEIRGFQGGDIYDCYFGFKLRVDWFTEASASENRTLKVETAANPEGTVVVILACVITSF
jgi:hypothetical protein